jgi:hypothetical protein
MHPDRPRDPSGVAIEPAEAAIVTELFATYLQPDMTLAKLAKLLQRRGLPSPFGRPRWSGSTIRGILRNPTYTGQVYAQRSHYRAPQIRRSTTHPLGHAHSTATPQPPESWILVGTVLAIISQEQFAQVQAKLAQNQSFASRNNTAHQYLLRAMVSCGVCQLACIARTVNGHNHYYLCNGKAQAVHSHRDEPCPARHTPGDQLDALVWQDLCHVLTHPEVICNALTRARGGAWLPQDLQARRENLHKGRASLRQQLDRLTEAYLRGVIPLDEYERRRHELVQKEQALAGETEQQQQLTGVANSIEAFCQRIQQGLANTTFEQKRQLVMLLIDRVIVTNDEVEIRYVIPTSPASEQVRFCHLRKDYFHHPTPGQQNEAVLGRRQFDDFQPDAVGLRVGGGLVASVALIHKGHLHRVARGSLNLFGQCLDLGAVLLVGGGNQRRQQLAQRIHGQVYLAAAAAFVPIIARARTAFRTRLQRAAIHDRRARLRGPASDLAQQHTQVADHVRKHSGFQPALRLLVDRVPQGQVVGHHAPGRTGTHEIAQTIEDLPQGMLALRGVLGHQGQVGGNERPLVITHVTRICFLVHALSLPRSGQSS